MKIFFKNTPGTFIAITLMLLYSTTFSQTRNVFSNPSQGESEMCWWYEKPATKYWEGLPIGTGRFAAMVLGKIENEEIPFNEETLWSGGPYNPNNPRGPEILKQIRKYVQEKNYVKATAEAVKLSSIPVSVQDYQPMGTLHISFQNHNKKNIVNYKRKLSMDSALATVMYSLDGVNYKREMFASYVDQVIVVKLTASKRRSINVNSWLSSLQPSAVSYQKEGIIVMHGTTKEISEGRNKDHVIPSKIKWQSGLKLIADGGRITYHKTEGKTGDMVSVKNANSVTLVLAGATNWKSWNNVSANEQKRCDQYLQHASKHVYVDLKKRHVKDYSAMFNTCKIDLGTNEFAGQNTTERIKRLRAGGDDPLFISQYFQYGRYLLLAGARENTLAFNNHNIWLDNMEGRWHGRWTLNINLEECYWPVENTNLPKLNESLLHFTEMLAQAGTRTAKELYGCSGWTAHHGTDIWFNTAPTDSNPQHATWPMGGAWLMQQLYDHYTYEPDKKYLNRIYPLLKGSAEFFLDFLITDSTTGYLVTCPATTPENSFYDDNGEKVSVSKGTAMDIQIIRNLFRNCLQATKILKTDTDLSCQLTEALLKLPPHQIGKYGQLQEWFYDFKEWEVDHRHLSPLFASYPDDDITLRKTPELAKAVEIVLARRGDINHGWSGAWKINQHARLEEAEPAYKILKSMLTEISIHPREEDSDITPSFEGNQGIQGVTAGICELLMQSHSEEIYLLPALPKAWEDGYIKGLRGRGGYLVDITWKNNELSKAQIRCKFKNTCRLRCKTSIKIMVNGMRELPINRHNGLYVFQVLPGNFYLIKRIFK